MLVKAMVSLHAYLLFLMVNAALSPPDIIHTALEPRTERSQEQFLRMEKYIIQAECIIFQIMS